MANGGLALSGAKAQGQIVAVRRETISASDQSPSYFITFRFRDSTGVSHTVSPKTSLSSYARYSVGDHVDVVYRPERPEYASLGAVDSVYGVPIVVCLIGGSLFMSAVFRSEDPNPA